MQMRNLLKLSRNLKKSQTLLLGSLLIFVGFFTIFFDYFARMKDEVYSDMKIAMMGFESRPNEVSFVSNNDSSSEKKDKEEVIDYSVYLGVLEIPRIGLKRGFYSVDHKLNNIEHNVTLVQGSDLPDVSNGNIILIAHSGDSYISYFAYLYMLEIGDDCYILYNHQAYHYRIVNIYEVEKNGIVSIDRNYDKSTLTMITCTKNNDSLQTVYIAEFVG